MQSCAMRSGIKNEVSKIFWVFVGDASHLSETTFNSNRKKNIIKLPI